MFRVIAFLTMFLTAGTAYAANDSVFVSQSVPSTMTPGQTILVSVTFKNTGTTTWTETTNGKYAMGSQNPTYNNTWGINQVWHYGQNVAPGQTKTFSFNAKAPSTPGTYNFQWRMMQRNQPFFGQTSPNVAVVVAVSDTTPPTRSGGAPTGTLAAGTTQATLALTTNEAATCKYGQTANTPYASMTGTFSTTGGTSHSASVTSLTSGQSYAYYVRCMDAAGNANVDDFPIQFAVAPPPDTTPPARSSGAPTGTLAAGTTQATAAVSSSLARIGRWPSAAQVRMSRRSAASSAMRISRRFIFTPRRSYLVKQSFRGLGASRVHEGRFTRREEATGIPEV